MMTWAKIFALLLGIADRIAGMIEFEKVRGTGIDKQIADSLTSLNRRTAIGLQIEREHRSVDDALGELRRPKSPGDRAAGQ